MRFAFEESWGNSFIGFVLNVFDVFKNSCQRPKKEDLRGMVYKIDTKQAEKANTENCNFTVCGDVAV